MGTCLRVPFCVAANGELVPRGSVILVDVFFETTVAVVLLCLRKRACARSRILRRTIAFGGFLLNRDGFVLYCER